MTLLGPVTPGRVPTVIDQDEDRHTIVMSSAPAGWTDWKTELMHGRVDPGVARTLGGLLATWHRQTRHPSALLEPEFDEYEAFEALRLDPYFRTSAARAPEVAAELLSVVSDMAARRSCLVHGDFSPKNVLVGPGPRRSCRDGIEAVTLWVIDFEVAHRGDPTFDVAFMCTHLLMKSYVRPDISGELDAAREAFLTAYSDSPPARTGSEHGPVAQGPASDPNLDWWHLSRVIGSLLIARVKGKSPADYLDGPARRHVLALGTDLLREPAASSEAITRRRDEHTG